MEPYPDLPVVTASSARVYLARDGALPRPLTDFVVIGASLSSEGWSPTPTRNWPGSSPPESI